MKYLVVGAEGAGGCIGAFMAEGGKDITLIDRGEHADAIQINGIRMDTTHRGNYGIYTIMLSDMEQYEEKANVIFLCWNGYSIEETIAFIKKSAGPQTMVIPLSGLYGIVDHLRKELPELPVIEGCVYVTAYTSKPGTIRMEEGTFRMVCSIGEDTGYTPLLDIVAADLRDCGIDTVFSKETQTLRKKIVETVEAL
ncbi:MAG: hypothetical protein LBQ88_03910 [Treponema sp.]|nr:hypothetical protein [Treponema sp.]